MPISSSLTYNLKDSVPGAAPEEALQQATTLSFIPKGDDIAALVASGNKVITSLSIGYSEIPEDSFAAVAEAFPTLTFLDVSSCDNFTDGAFLAVCKALPALEKIYCRGCSKLTGAGGAAAIEASTALKTVDAEGTRTVDDAWLRAFASKGITSWSVQEASITEAGLIALAKAAPPVVANLNLCSDAVTDAALTAIATPALQELHVYLCTKFTAAGLQALAPCKLTKLSASQVSAKLQGLGAALQGSADTLTSVDFTMTPSVDDAALAGLAQCKALKTIKVSHAPITDAGVAALGVMPDVEEVEFKLCGDLGTGACVALAQWPKLKVVSLSGSKVDEEGALAFADKNITGLDVTRTSVPRGFKVPGVKYLSA